MALKKLTCPHCGKSFYTEQKGGKKEKKGGMFELPTIKTTKSGSSLLGWIPLLIVVYLIARLYVTGG